MRKDLIKFVDASEEHLELIFNWRNEPSIREVMYNDDKIEWENHVRWFQSIVQDELKLIKIIYYENIPYGVANFYLTNKELKIGEWGFYIGEKNSPKGLGKILAYSMLNFLFEEANIRKICAEVLEFNNISINFHKKVGFAKEGVLRKHFYRNNRYWDIHLFSIFKDEWLNRKVILEKELF